MRFVTISPTAPFPDLQNVNKSMEDITTFAKQSVDIAQRVDASTDNQTNGFMMLKIAPIMGAAALVLIQFLLIKN
ncbi:hypothetical protein JOC86_000134 [Bacillus pakistanensis]|uniref:Uncharacterized protein n=1 Tax=Rossellomorea pakistanensis TaxID=992288 RepID=A0ABS2N6V8_9BACI|nr:hypothetical protein [Bacillus pakistanensis]MBM7583597.1 hypothetical protein [Bacillus pakistanensis]